MAMALIAKNEAFLDDVSRGRFQYIKMAAPHILDSIARIPYSRSGAFTICDYGTLDGTTSMALIEECIVKIKEIHGADTEVNVLYEDVPDNDYNMLLRTINGSGNGHPTYMLRYDDVFVSAIGTGFYRQCVPSNSVHLALSAGAMHFLEKRPCSLTGTMHHTMAKNENEKRLFAEQAAKDWEKILLLRARELAPGGTMVITQLSRDKDGQSCGATHNIKHSLFGQLDEIWKKMLEEKKITQEGYDQLTFSEYFRDEEESIAPLITTISDVYKAGLRLVSIETRIIPCVYHTKWIKEGKQGDPEARWEHARKFTEKTRSWAVGHIKPCLGNDRSPEERDAILEDIFNEYTTRIAAAPQDHGMEYVVQNICINKVV